MITAPRETAPSPVPEFWGKVKGMIRHIEIHRGGEYAVYAIEESPGFREIRFNRRKYRIFFPWIYFFVRVTKGCETKGGKLYVLVSKKQLKDLDDPSLLLAPFPSSLKGGAICMPDGRNKMTKPIHTALDVICEFWKSNSAELRSDGQCTIPTQLSKGKTFSKLGSVYGNWSRLTAEQALNMDFEKPERNSIRTMATKAGWDF